MTVEDFVRRGQAAQRAADTVLIEQLVTELAALPPMGLVLQPSTVFQLTGLVQLAMRHPAVDAEVRLAGERFVDVARQYLVDCPIALDVVRRGADPQEDR